MWLDQAARRGRIDPDVARPNGGCIRPWPILMLQRVPPSTGANHDGQTHPTDPLDVSDIQPLLDNTGLGSGDTVDLTDTNVSCNDALLLGANGVTVLGVECPIVLLAPAVGAVLDNGCTLQANSTIWDFDWEDVPGATLYGIFIQKTGFNALRDLSDLTESSYQYNSPSGHTPDTNLTGWSWRVRAYVKRVWTDWSDERGFEVEPVNTDC